MKRGVATVLLISGLCTLCSCLSHQYHFVNTAMKFSDAKKHCNDNYDDLATIDNQEEMQVLMGVVGSTYTGNAWIGLERKGSINWHWSLADTGFYGDGEAEFRNWMAGHPGDDACTGMTVAGTWRTGPCGGQRAFICYDGDAAQSYILITESKTWRGAQSYCREHHTDLASVRNHAENQEILQTAGGTGVWIGLFKDSWEWSDQSSSSYRNWRSGQPDDDGGKGDCVAMMASGSDPNSGQWSDWNCDILYNFLCYKCESIFTVGMTPMVTFESTATDNLVLVQENKNWDEALSYCRQHYGDLVSVSTEQLQHWVEIIAQNASTAHVWLGLRYSCKMHFWFWLNGKILPLENEYNECGRRGAVESGGGRQWVSLPETEKLNFICSKCGVAMEILGVDAALFCLVKNSFGQLLGMFLLLGEEVLVHLDGSINAVLELQ
ncbi:hypothetical protein AGOR_G00032440 [Albula goreensis]|uniref:C-type lectin domain-containing protein n=1 Tax=Albula goreensis TaxID=1534307 RepID=A0A8T3E3R3_9TELE|nr:hypothetical protein AGOR_G00032440 [Albula goreensis]